MSYFISVAQNLSFTKAAEECCVAQTAISQQISAFEDEVGFVLLNRNKRSVKLTPAGEYFYQQGISIIKQFDNAVERGRLISQGFGGSLKIGFYGLYEQMVMKRILQDFRVAHPTIYVDVAQHNSKDLIRLLEDGCLDAVCELRHNLEGIRDAEIKDIISDFSVFGISKNNPLARKDFLTAEDLKTQPLITTDEEDLPQNFQRVKTLYEGMGLNFRQISTVNSFYSLMMALEMGLGVAVLPSGIGAFCHDFDIKLIPVRELNAPVKISVARKKNSKNPVLKKFFQEIEEMEIPRYIH
ncbi:MAG: LysR family transcriptional regulator [Syntrophomonadaceae bacterium]|nr:LysR family transcriptional regulator [Syntrophomonadaceae bacterium]